MKRVGLSVFLGEVRELSKEVGLFGSQLLWNLHHDANQLISSTASAQLGQTLILESEDFMRLGSSRNLHFNFAIESRDVNVGSERGMNERDRDVANHIRAFAFKEIVIENIDQNIKVAAWAAMFARFAFIRKLEALAGVDPGRNGD